MDIELLRDFCLQLPGTTEDLKWGDNLCFLVENKIFLLCSLGEEIKINLKIDPECFEEITNREGVKQAFHMAKRHWVSIDGFNVLSPMALKQMILESRMLVIKKLPKKTQALYV